MRPNIGRTSPRSLSLSGGIDRLVVCSIAIGSASTNMKVGCRELRISEKG